MYDPVCSVCNHEIIKVPHVSKWGHFHLVCHCVCEACGCGGSAHTPNGIVCLGNQINGLSQRVEALEDEING